jgi:hypothetical protein
LAVLHNWQTLYAAAMLESDSTRVQQRIEKADQAIHARLRELPETFSPGSEQAELSYALTYLGRLYQDSEFNSKPMLSQSAPTAKSVASDTRLKQLRLRIAL